MMRYYFFFVWSALSLFALAADSSQDKSKSVDPSYELYSCGTRNCIVISPDKKYGLADLNRKMLTPMKYDLIYDLGDEYNAGEIDKKYCLLGPGGNELTPLKYDVINYYDDKRFQVYIDSKTGLVDLKGKEVIPVQYSYIAEKPKNIYGAGIKSDKLLVMTDGKWGCLDDNGKAIIPVKYDQLGYYDADFLVGQLDGKTSILDMQGRTVYEAECTEIIHYDPANKMAICEIYAENSLEQGVFLIYADGKKEKYEDYWAANDGDTARFKKGQFYLFVDNAMLYGSPGAESDATDSLTIGSGITVLAYDRYFLRDGTAYLKAVYDNGGYDFAESNLNFTIMDRWARVKVNGTGKEGYVLESCLAGNGFYEDLDADGKKDLLLIKNHAYHNFLELRHSEGSEKSKLNLFSVRIACNNALVRQVTITDVIQQASTDGYAIDSYTLGGYTFTLDFIKVPAGNPLFFFLTLAWEYGRDDYSGASLKYFYYFKNNQFIHADTEHSGHKGGGAFASKKELLYDKKRKTAILKEKFDTYDHGFEESYSRSYYWDKKKMKFILEKEEKTKSVDLISGN